ncbi:MAG: hypothetical protein HY071_01280 [Chloroflexi bacterium]|nr:hypothetical protein [Chloroflexota bacterium]
MTRGLLLTIGVAGLLLAWAGGAWDVAWHRTIGRDTFWTAPHVLIYGGVALSGLSALIATVQTVSRGATSHELRVGPLRCELGLALVGIGALSAILSAPVDDAWHAAFGRDVDIWSPPHLFAVAAISLIFVGWALALEPGMFPIPDPLRRLLRIVVLSGIVGVAVFAENFYYMLTSTREAFFYPLLTALLATVALGFGARLIGGRWAATWIALAYTVVTLVVIGALQSTGWRAPAFPPMVLAGAFALDLVRARSRSPLLLGAAFAVAFVAAEFLRSAVLTPVGGVAVPGPLVSTLRESSLFDFYRAQAIARPWNSLWPLFALVAATPLAALGWVIGTRYGALLLEPSDSHATEPVALTGPRRVQRCADAERPLTQRDPAIGKRDQARIRDARRRDAGGR